MANIKITDLTAYTDAASTDVLPIVDVGADVTKKITISNVVKAVPLGTAALPGLAFDGDPNSGVYSPGADQVAISTNGTGRLFVDASGNVGIGAAPDGQLSLLGANSNTPRFRIQHPSNNKDAAISTYFDGSGTYLFLGSNHYVNSSGANTKFDATAGSSAWYLDGTGIGIFYNSSGSGLISERLRITSDGKLGVGTSTPGSYWSGVNNLVIADSSDAGLAIKSGTGNFGTIAFTDTVSTANEGFIQYDHNLNRLKFGTNSTDALFIDSSQRVGLGTSSPSKNVEINGTASRLTVDVNNAYTLVNHVNSAGTFFVHSVQSAGTYRFQIGSNEKARIDSDGRLLVGTSSTTQTNTRAIFQGTPLSTTGTAFLYLSMGRNNPTSGQELGVLAFSDNGHQLAAKIAGVCDGGWTTGTDQPSALVFSTTADSASSPTEHVRINNVGTTTVWSTSAPMLWGRNETDGSIVGLAYYNTATSTTSLTGQVFRVMCDGDVENTNNAYGAISDITLKENIVDAKSQWDDLKALQVRNYNFKPETGFSTHTQIGLVAQEVELVSPGLVGESIDEETGESTKSVNYSVLYMKAVKALQEAMERIEVLEAKVNALEGN